MIGTLAEKIASFIITAGSLLFPSVGGINPSFSDVQIAVVNNGIVCSARLINCYSEELDKIFLSGKEIRINFTVQTFEQGKEKPMHERKFCHQMKYDLVDQYFEVYLSETDEKFITESLDEVKERMARIERFVAVKVSLLEFGKRHYLKFTASMEPVFFDAFQKNIDLMIYWNNKKATFLSELFEKPAL